MTRKAARRESVDIVDGEKLARKIHSWLERKGAERKVKEQNIPSCRWEGGRESRPDAACYQLAATAETVGLGLRPRCRTASGKGRRRGGDFV